MPDEPTGGTNPGNPAGFIARQVREGMSSTAGLKQFREAGGKVRTQTWYRLRGEIEDTIARRPAFGSIDPARLPHPDEYGVWSMGRGGQYATQVNIRFIDRDSGMPGTSQFTHITNDPHTPDEAIARARDLWTAGDNESQYGQTYMGADVSGVWTTVAYAS